jgi:hypothetical protein
MDSRRRAVEFRGDDVVPDEAEGDVDGEAELDEIDVEDDDDDDGDRRAGGPSRSADLPGGRARGRARGGRGEAGRTAGCRVGAR